MRAHRYLPNYTIADYRLWEGAWELIDGVPSAMTPAPTKRHQILAMELILQLGNALKDLKYACGNCRVVHETDWEIDNHTVFRPDIAVICDDDTGDVINKPPKMIIEILSPSSALKDRHTKYGIYEEQSVQYYIIVDPSNNTHNVFVLNNGTYEAHNDTRNFSINSSCVLELDIDSALSNLPK